MEKKKKGIACADRNRNCCLHRRPRLSALSYFWFKRKKLQRGRRAVHQLSSLRKDVVEEDTQSDSSKNIFQWLKERLAADKAQEEVTLPDGHDRPASTQSGMSQTIPPVGGAAKEDLTPIQQAAKDAQQANSKKKKDAAEDDTPAQEENTPQEQPAQEDTKKNP